MHSGPAHESASSSGGRPEPALSPQLEALRQRALGSGPVAGGPVAGDPAGADDGAGAAPRWLALLPRLGLVLSGLPLLAGVALRLVGPTPTSEDSSLLELLLSLLSPACLVIPGAYVLAEALRPWAGNAQLTLLAPGIIEGDATQSAPGDGTWLECPGVAYAYEVAGQLHRGRAGAAWLSNSASMLRRYRAKQPRPGATVIVRYAPNHPERSVVAGYEPRIGVVAWLSAGLLLFGLCLAVWFLIPLVARVAAP